MLTPNTRSPPTARSGESVGRRHASRTEISTQALTHFYPRHWLRFGEILSRLSLLFLTKYTR